MVRSTLIDLNTVELNYYPFMISLHKVTGSCNVLSPKICVLKETKDINVNPNKVGLFEGTFSCEGGRGG